MSSSAADPGDVAGLSIHADPGGARAEDLNQLSGNLSIGSRLLSSGVAFLFMAFLFAFFYLRAVNSGHPGSITTVHADSPAGALDQIALLAMTSGVDLGWDKVRAYVERVVDVVVQLDRTQGARRLTEVMFRPGRPA